MKGRRRARRVALQALYELDLTAHDLEAVLGARLRAYYRAAADAALPAGARGAVAALLRAAPDGRPHEADIAAAAALPGSDDAAAREAAELLERARPNAEYAAEICRAVWRNREALDAVIGRIAPEWPVEQMAPVDRNVLRIALWEATSAGVPLRVAINEAVELARFFSGEGARRMVNGALGAYAKAGQVPDLQD